MFFPSSAVDSLKEKMPHQVLTKIIGEPDYTSLKKLRSEVKANASAIHSTLGGGANGHLGLVVTPVAYARVSGTPWVQPAHPGDIAVVPPGTSSHVAAHLRDTHAKHLHHFNLADSVTKIISAQIKNAIDEDYIAAEINDNSGQFINSIPDTISNLFSEYGSIKPEYIDEKMTAFKSKHYDPAIPLASTFKKLEDIVDLGDAAGIPYTVQQQISIMLEILKKTGRFAKYITTWNATVAADKTWPRFKLHFTAARKEMKDNGELDNVANNQFQANAIREAIAEGVAEAFQTHTPSFPFAGHTSFGGLGGFNPFINIPPTTGGITDDESRAPPSIAPTSDDSASKASDPLSAFYSMSKNNNDKMQQFEKSMTQIADQLSKLQTQLQQNQRMRNLQNGGGNPNANRAGHTLYCWSHGLCNHKGPDCRKKKEGHKDEATLENRMGGSEKGIRRGTNTNN